MNNKKLGFTLIELMATLAIFSVVMVLVSGILLQGYKILNRTSNYSDIENTFRNAILNIEKTVSSYEDKNIIIYNNKNRISIIDEEYPEDKQEALMCIIPKGESVVRDTEEKVIYMQVESKSGDKQLIEVIFEDADKDKFLDKENGVGPKVKITPKSTKVLISKLNSSGQVSFEDNNNIINIAIYGITSGKDVSEKVYSNSISLSEESDITIEVGEDSSGGGGINPDSKPDPPEVLPDEDKLEDFIKNMQHNVNIAGNLESHKSNDKHNSLIGSIGYISASGWKNDDVPGDENKNLSPIVFGNVEFKNISISSNSNSIDVAKKIDMPEGQEPYYVYLVNGDVNLIAPHSIKNIIVISSGTINISGVGGNGNSVQIFDITDSILYSTNMVINHKKGLEINGLPVVNILSKNTKNGKTLKEELKYLLNNAKIEIN